MDGPPVLAAWLLGEMLLDEAPPTHLGAGGLLRRDLQLVRIEAGLFVDGLQQVLADTISHLDVPPGPSPS